MRIFGFKNKKKESKSPHAAGSGPEAQFDDRVYSNDDESAASDVEGEEYADLPYSAGSEHDSDEYDENDEDTGDYRSRADDANELIGDGATFSEEDKSNEDENENKDEVDVASKAYTDVNGADNYCGYPFEAGGGKMIPVKRKG